MHVRSKNNVKSLWQYQRCAVCVCANVLCQLRDVAVSTLTASNEKAIQNEKKETFFFRVVIVVIVLNVAVSVRDSFAQR